MYACLSRNLFVHALGTPKTVDSPAQKPRSCNGDSPVFCCLDDSCRVLVCFEISSKDIFSFLDCWVQTKAHSLATVHGFFALTVIKLNTITRWHFFIFFSRKTYIHMWFGIALHYLPFWMFWRRIFYEEMLKRNWYTSIFYYVVVYLIWVYLY